MNWNYNYNFIESIGGEGLIQQGLTVNLHYTSTNGSGSWFDISGNGNNFSISGSLTNNGSNGWGFDGQGFQSVYYTGSGFVDNGVAWDFTKSTNYTVQMLFTPFSQTFGASGNWMVMFGSNDANVTYTASGRGTPWFLGVDINAATQSLNNISLKEGAQISVSAGDILNNSYTNNVTNNYYPLLSGSEGFISYNNSRATLNRKLYYNQSIVNSLDFNGTTTLNNSINGGMQGQTDCIIKFGWVNADENSNGGGITRAQAITAGYNPFCGNLKQILIYNRVLSGGEVTQNYVALKKGRYQ